MKADSGRFEDTTRAQLVYGYVEYKTPEGPISFKAGRTYVFQGVANESIDGVEVAVWGGNLVYLGALSGWTVADSFRR